MNKQEEIVSEEARLEGSPRERMRKERQLNDILMRKVYLSKTQQMFK